MYMNSKLQTLNHIRHGVRAVLQEVKTEKLIKLGKQHAKAILKNNNNIKLEIGSGPKKGINGWTTMDLFLECDIFWNLNRQLPFPDESLSEIYASHTLEHFNREQILRLLRECHRCLKPAGNIRLCVPNARIYVEAYMRAPLPFEPVDVYAPAYKIDSPIDYINYTAYMDGHHKHMFDEENLICVLLRSGFSNARLDRYNKEYDLELRDWESIYAIGIK